MQTLQRVDTAAGGLEGHIGKAFQQAVEGSSELAQVQTSQWETSRNTANELLAALQGMQDGHMVTLIQVVRDIGVRLVRVVRRLCG